MPTERRLAAIMFTDIVGYTALMARDEEAGRRARDRHEEVLRTLVERHSGRLIDATGDESLSSFPSALDAVNCALAVQGALRDESELRVRIGVHQADVTFEGDRISGDGVNVAARVRPLAEPGGICVSDEVQHSLRGRTDLEFASLGEQDLKNVGRPVEVFAVGRPGTVAVGRPRRASVREWKAGRSAVAALALAIAALIGWRIWDQIGSNGAVPIRSIAVLPLENLSGDPEQEYFADGMTEALIGDLAKLRSLTVISRTSVMRYKQSDKSLPEIAGELNVDGIIEGTVMRAGDRVRITAQLIDARSDSHLWSERFDRELADVLQLQSDVAQAVAEQVRLELTTGEREALTASRTVDPRAYDAYLRGLELRGPGNLVGVWGPQTIEQFERAVELDPDFAEGYAALAEARTWLGSSALDLRLRDEFPRAQEAALRALALDERLGSAHSSLASVRLFYHWDFAGADRACNRAVQLSPSDPFVLNNCAWYLLTVRRSEEALELMERLLRVAPLDRFYRQRQPSNLYFDGQYERALEELERVWEHDPDFVDIDVGYIFLMLGRVEEAHQALIATAERCGTPCEWSREARERGWAEGGWEGSERAWLEAAKDREWFSPEIIGAVYSGLGETDLAFEWLERGYRDRDPLMLALKIHPFSDAVRTDPRYDDLLRRIGFPES
jgi:TolB-like protein/class 3 adenylate cyclase/Flp pilus assembly protein TadD